MKILVVDDDVSFRTLYKQILEAENFQVETADDGVQALKLLQEGGYDLVLLDLKMPKMDGFATVENYKRTPPKTPNGPIFFLTNSEDEITIAKCVALEAQGYLIKSHYTPDMLVQEVKRILEAEKSKIAK